MSAEEIKRLKEQFNLGDHPAGGMFKEMWRGERKVTFTEKTAHDGPRNVGTSIHYLMTPPNIIPWHKILSNESYYWHTGGTVKVHFIEKDGRHHSVLLGDALKNPECVYHVLVAPDTWWACELVEGDYAFYSAVVMPGFEFRDWIPGKQEELVKAFPQHSDVIKSLSSE